ncbi:hypothetical protein BKA70DRAFT_1437444 [Coprinopsis sp. MPI-PUGE-AT-0042]|nr:hypothetical protein BKA70DRAFT_1437444 [Coprinopsis sp. MPI-PUGE-AT-0042]
MVAVSSLLPAELLSQIFEELGVPDLLALMRCSQLGRQLGDYELWRRLVRVVSPFLHLSCTLLLMFLRLMGTTGLGVVGDAALDFLLFDNPPAPVTATKVKELELAVNINSFSRTVEFFREAGYDVAVTWREDLNEPVPENVLGRARGTWGLVKDGCEYQVTIITTLNGPIEYIANLSATHLMNAITRAGIYCMYPGLTLDRKGLVSGICTPRNGMQIDDLNRYWTHDQCRKYCPGKVWNASNGAGILAYRWIGRLDRSGRYDDLELLRLTHRGREVGMGVGHRLLESMLQARSQTYTGMVR